MKDEPLLHPRKFDDLVLEYLFRDRHLSFPNRNPHMNKLMHNRMSVMKSTTRTLLRVLLVVQVRF
jgi:hypothetical protein